MKGLVRPLSFVLLVLCLAGEAQAQSFIPALRVDALPAHQGQTFVLTGATFGYDLVHVWGFPSTGPVFLGVAGADKIDRVLQKPTGGFELLIRNAPLGSYPIVVYAHDPITGAFPVQWSQVFNVHPCAKTMTATRWIPRLAGSDPMFSPFGYQFFAICEAGT